MEWRRNVILYKKGIKLDPTQNPEELTFKTI